MGMCMQLIKNEKSGICRCHGLPSVVLYSPKLEISKISKNNLVHLLFYLAEYTLG